MPYAALVLLALAPALLSAACYLSYRLDQARLRRVALGVAHDAAGPGDRAIRLMSWVYGNRGFGKNPRHFLIRRLGPTPVHVLDGGGDCADKSRLLSSMLRSVGIPSTLAMCFDASGRPTHTIVNARLPDGSSLVLDPIWDLYFPREDSPGYYGLLDLRRDPAVLWRRLERVVAGAEPGAKIRRYNRSHDVYDAASTYNWEKNAATRATRAVLGRWMGDRVYGLPRPAFLEEPKLFVALASLLLALAALAALTAVRQRTAAANATGSATARLRPQEGHGVEAARPGQSGHPAPLMAPRQATPS